MKEGKKGQICYCRDFSGRKLEDSGSTSCEFFEWLGAVLP